MFCALSIILGLYIPQRFENFVLVFGWKCVRGWGRGRVRDPLWWVHSKALVSVTYQCNGMPSHRTCTITCLINNQTDFDERQLQYQCVVAEDEMVVAIYNSIP